MLTVENNVFVAKYGYHDRQIPKDAGFWWHGGGCRSGCVACENGLPLKRWWTPKPEVAVRLIDHADAAAKALLKSHTDAVDASKASDADIDVPSPDGLDYLPYQRAGIAYVMERENTLIADEMGLGKGQPIDSTVLSPFGWVRIGSLEVGDTVIGSNGKAIKVTGVFPRGELDVYRVTFTDGKSLVVDGDHLWAVQSANDQHRGKSFRVMKTSDLIGNLKHANGNNIWRIPVVDPIELECGDERLLHPYLLGVLLGDVAAHPSGVRVTTGDTLVPVQVAKCLPPDVRLSSTSVEGEFTLTTEPRSAANPVTEALRSLGLMGLRSHERFVPEAYLFAPVGVRKLLLQGLLDTDGEARADGHIEFTSTSLALAKAVEFLVESLGGTTKAIREKQGAYKNKRGERVECRVAYRVTICMPPDVNPFLAHADRYIPRTKYLPNRVIESIEPCGREQVVCISVSAKDRLYVTEHCTVTHNTIQALGAVNATPDAKSVLVVVPASLRLNWQREAQKWLVRPWNIHVVETQKAPIPADADFVVVNYEMIRGKMATVPVMVDGPDKDEHGKPIQIPKLDDKGKVVPLIGPDKKPVKQWEPAPVLSQIMERSWDLLVVDECHRVKNPKALQTKCLLGFAGTKAKKFDDRVIGLITRASRKIFLTGTPILNRPVELQPLAGALAPAEFGNFFRYAKRYCGAFKGTWGWDFTGATNLGELQERLRASIMVRRLKKDVLKELPPKRRQVIPLPANGSAKFVKMEQEAMKAHEDRMAAVQAELDFAHASGDEEAYKAAVAALREAQAVQFSEMARVRAELAVAKAPKVVEYVESALESEQKVIVFVHHHTMADALMDHFGDAAVAITGQVTNKAKRQEAVDRFQTDDSVRVFVGSIKAAGEGLTLTAASTVIFAELDWVPANISQCEDRAHRIGQTDFVQVIHLVIDGSLDQRMAEEIVAKQDIADKALDEGSRLVLGEPVAPRPEGQPRRPSKYPPVSAEKKAAALTAMQLLSGACDGAQVKDGAGFNKLDTGIGHKLAALSELTDGQAWLATNLARKYQRQLPGELLATLSIGAKV